VVRNPITKLAQLNEITLDLNMEQGWINHAREAARTNQIVQLSLDRQQTAVNAKREMIEFAMIDISSRN
jgi:hypothetical protein